MSVDGIFLRAGGRLAVLSQTPYRSESLLQEVLASHPEIIAGPTTTGDEETRLLLVRSEMGVPSVDGGGRTWRLDHLFIDAEGIPVLVEVKRSSNAEIRREIVGQMLDYAANGVRYWPPSAMRQTLLQAIEERSRDGEEMLTEEGILADLRPGFDPDEFWRTVEANLRAGRIRMIFVSDKLPPELIRIIEFLNEQMNPAEVLGVEVRQYLDAEHAVFVPSVKGRTATAINAKASRSGPRWERESFLDAASERCSVAEVALMRRLFDDVDQRGGDLRWGAGGRPGVGGWYPLAGELGAVWELNANSDSSTTSAWLRFRLGSVAGRLGADRVDRAATKLEEIPRLGPKIVDARKSAWRKLPSLYLNEVVTDEHQVQLIFDMIGDLVLDH